jgi:hypothetical protein
MKWNTDDRDGADGHGFGKAKAFFNGTLIVMIVMMGHDLLTREYLNADDTD